jgi:hypothetical protein
MSLRLLIVSPIPSYPQDQGNSARIHVLGQALRQAGVIVHFLYAQMEGLTSAQCAAMEADWDYFHPVPYAPADMSPTGDDSYRIDDWYDPAVTRAAADLNRRWHFHAVLTNYVWFSRILTAFPSSVLKILDTHDVFGDRDRRFRDAGLVPEWFFTTPAEEAQGLFRADIVLAIQDEEAALFRAAGHNDVRVIGHAPGRRQRRSRCHPETVCVGYLASGNPLNRRSLAELATHLPVSGVPGLRFVVAGSICDGLSEQPGPFERLGRVDTLDDFYDCVDVVVNPMSFGTGLKIKSVEAIFQGVPLLATKPAMVGLPVRHPFHELADPQAMAACLTSTCFDEAMLGALREASWTSALDYRGTVRAGVSTLVESIHETAAASLAA